MVMLWLLLWTAPAWCQPASHGVADATQRRELRHDARVAGERRLVDAVSLGYTIAVIAFGGLGVLLSIGILCMPPPPCERTRSER
jgi:hypothetical protein